MGRSLSTVWIFALIFLINADIVGRALFNSPVKGVPELVALSIVGIVYLELATTLRANRFVRSETSWEYNEINLPGGSVDTTLLRERLSLAWSPRLRLDTFVQYNDLDELFGANVRFNWIYKPGADLFVVFNQTWDAPSLDALDRRDRQVIVKFTYLWQR